MRNFWFLLLVCTLFGCDDTAGDVSIPGDDDSADDDSAGDDDSSDDDSADDDSAAGDDDSSDDDSADDDSAAGDDDSASAAEVCTNTVDDDGDELVDCDDPDCNCSGDDDVTADDDDVTPPVDDDDATTPPGDDDDATEEPTPAPVTLNCVPDWVIAPYDGGDWTLCWGQVWDPTLNTWDSVGGVNDEVGGTSSIWLTFGAASQANANAIGQGFEDLVLAGQVVFANVNTGEVAAWVHADGPSPSPWNGAYRWMVSPNSGAVLLGPSPVTNVVW